MANENNMVILIQVATIMRRHHVLSEDLPEELQEALKNFDKLPEYYKMSKDWKPDAS